MVIGDHHHRFLKCSVKIFSENCCDQWPFPGQIVHWNQFALGYRPDLAGGAYSAPADSVAGGEGGVLPHPKEPHLCPLLFRPWAAGLSNSLPTCRLWYSRICAETTTTVLRSFVRDYPGEPVPEETLSHPPSWSSSNLYQLLPSTTIHSILLVQITCLAIFLHNLFTCSLWSTSWSGALHLIFHTFLYPNSVFFSQHIPIPSQPVLL